MRECARGMEAYLCNIFDYSLSSIFFNVLIEIICKHLNIFLTIKSTLLKLFTVGINISSDIYSSLGLV